jgi:hypothetical protein
LGTAEKRSNWEFFSGPHGDWFWNVMHPDGKPARAAQSFRILKERIDDARKHGYVPWPPDNERRKNS